MKRSAKRTENKAISRNEDQFGRCYTYSTADAEDAVCCACRSGETLEGNASTWCDSAIYKSLGKTVVMVRKRDGTHRSFVDYRKLNTVTKPDFYSLLRIDDLLDQLGNLVLLIIVHSH